MIVLSQPHHRRSLLCLLAQISSGRAPAASCHSMLHTSLRKAYCATRLLIHCLTDYYDRFDSLKNLQPQQVTRSLDATNGRGFRHHVSHRCGSLCGSSRLPAPGLSLLGKKLRSRMVNGIGAQDAYEC